MAGLDLTTIDKLLKDVYLPPIREQMKKATILSTAIEGKTAVLTPDGRGCIFPIMTQYSEGVGARADNDDLPDADYTRYTTVTVAVKSNYGVIYLTGKAIRQSKSSIGAFTRGLQSEMENMVNGLKRDINRQMFGVGTGQLAQVTQNATAGNNVTITVDNVQYLAKNMKVDIYEGSILRANGRTITAVDATNSTITIDVLDGNLTAASTPLVYRKGAKDKEIYGLGNIVNNTNWLVNPVDYPVWVANSEDLGGTYTANEMLQAMQKVWSAIEENGETTPDLIVTTRAVRDQYAAALTTLKRMVNTTTNVFGFSGPEFNGVPIIADGQCTKNTMYFLSTKYLAEQVGADFDWGQEDGKILAKVAQKDAYTAFLYKDHQFACTRRNAHGKLTGWNL